MTSNQYMGQGANGGCIFEIEGTDESGEADLTVGWSSVIVHRGPIPVTWLAELIAIASGHPEGIAGFLKQHDYGQPSYALMCDPAPAYEQR